METTVLGRAGFRVSRTGFGCLPIQRVTEAEAGRLLCRALDAGITLFDTARMYTDSEAKIGAAIASRRGEYTLATKTTAQNADGFWKQLTESLRLLRTDCVDIYQFHNPPFVPMPGGEDGLFDAAAEAKRRGMIRAIGITQHAVSLAREAVDSGLYDTLQYPFNHLATAEEVALVAWCADKNVGFLCMKAMSGGLVTDAAIPFSFIRQYPASVPIWGFQRPEELEQLIALSENPPALDDTMRARVEADRAALSGSFCRGCGYCLPCPQAIPIHNANRMTQLLTRSPSAQWLTDEWRDGMAKIASCTQCGACAKRCPYGLRPHETLPSHLAFYNGFVKGGQ